MRILKIEPRKKKEIKRILDPYQESIHRNGRSQIKQLIEKGLSFQIVVL
jgi:hypothetical protein